MAKIMRTEYPRPQFKRDTWQNLNGEWEFEFDFGCSGEERKLYNFEHFDKKITVPFCPESRLSGIEYTDFMNSVWYLKDVEIPKEWTENGRRTHINIDACDYEATVYVNGQKVGNHKGGYVGFSFDITDYVNAGTNRIVVNALDDSRDNLHPRGKQSDKYNSYGCLYTRITGIWQTVWLENTPANYIKSVKMTPSLKNASLTVEAEVVGEGKIEADISFQGEPVARAEAVTSFGGARLFMNIPQVYEWNMETPNLYDITFTFGEDKVESYFGLRDIEFRDGKTYLNGKSIFQRLILDQGYYPDGIYTAPSDEELINDILRSKAMGYNGARLHEKVFEPRFLYHCDRLGYIVWGEHANWGLDSTKETAWGGFLPEWLEIIKRDYNHPAIIGWCPLNETPGTVIPEFVQYLYAVTKTYDNTRIFIDNSGHHHVDGCFDMFDVHDYCGEPEALREKYMALVNGGKVKAYDGLEDHNGYICQERDDISFISEFGGARWVIGENDGNNWGYGNQVNDEKGFIDRYKGFCDALLDNPKICAFCYTQLTDVEQEQNGLYTYDRRAKFDAVVIKAITSRKAAVED